MSHCIRSPSVWTPNVTVTSAHLQRNWQVTHFWNPQQKRANYLQIRHTSDMNQVPQSVQNDTQSECSVRSEVITVQLQRIQVSCKDMLCHCASASLEFWTKSCCKSLTQWHSVTLNRPASAVQEGHKILSKTHKPQVSGMWQCFQHNHNSVQLYNFEVNCLHNPPTSHRKPQLKLICTSKQMLHFLVHKTGT
jgi:hypothetical protein